MKDDVSLIVNGTQIQGKDILTAIDNAISYLNETNDLETVETALKNLMGIEKVSGMGIARLLKGVQEWWERTEQDEKMGDTFSDWAFGVSTDFNRLYLERCISVSKYQEQGVFTDRISERRLADQQAIASHLDQGYELDDDAWDELEDAVTNSDVLRILREAKGKPPRKNSLSISLDRKGTLTVWYQDTPVYGGYLRQPEDGDDELERQALEKMNKRIVKNSGVSQK